MALNIATLPPLSWTGIEGEAEIDAVDGSLLLRAAAGVDWTNPASGAEQQQAATALAFDPGAGDFTLSARVRVAGTRTTFDAAALAVWSDENHWAKLCHEYSPQHEPMVVSVVTDVFSDDCNSGFVGRDVVFLRLARVGAAFAFHSSSDGQVWEFIRVFRLDPGAAPLSVGFLSQAPTGDTCVAVFDHLEFVRKRIDNLRDGS